MNNYDFINTIYDILAQNEVSQAERDEITEVIDHADSERHALVFKLSNGREFELQLVDSYAPSSEVARSANR